MHCRIIWDCMNKIKQMIKINTWKRRYNNGSVVISDKLDGNSCMLRYDNCVSKLYTRGDGKNGFDISHFINHIEGMPIEHKYSTYTIRGELIISKINFDKNAKTIFKLVKCKEYSCCNYQLQNTRYINCKVYIICWTY